MKLRLVSWRGAALSLITLPLLAGCMQAPPESQKAAGLEAAWSPPPLVGDAGDLPDARGVVQRAIDFVSSHDRLGFEVIATYEVLQDNGQKLEFGMLQRGAFERGSRFFWVTLNDDATTDSSQSTQSATAFFTEASSLNRVCLAAMRACLCESRSLRKGLDH